MKNLLILIAVKACFSNCIENAMVFPFSSVMDQTAVLAVIDGECKFKETMVSAYFPKDKLVMSCRQDEVKEFHSKKILYSRCTSDICRQGENPTIWVQLDSIQHEIDVVCPKKVK